MSTKKNIRRAGVVAMAFPFVIMGAGSAYAQGLDSPTSSDDSIVATEEALKDAINDALDKDSQEGDTVLDDTPSLTIKLVGEEIDGVSLELLDADGKVIASADTSKSGVATFDLSGVPDEAAQYEIKVEEGRDITSVKALVTDLSEDETTPPGDEDEPTPPVDEDEPTPPVDEDEPTPPVDEDEPTPPVDEDEPTPTPPVDEDEPTPPVDEDEPTPTPPVDEDANAVADEVVSLSAIVLDADNITDLFGADGFSLGDHEVTQDQIDLYDMVPGAVYSITDGESVSLYGISEVVDQGDGTFTVTFVEADTDGDANPDEDTPPVDNDRTPTELDVDINDDGSGFTFQADNTSSISAEVNLADLDDNNDGGNNNNDEDKDVPKTDDDDKDVPKTDDDGKTDDDEKDDTEYGPKVKTGGSVANAGFFSSVKALFS